jgi:uncharacterized protein with NRDE domain
MCTLACWIGTHPRAPLVIAANRDEALGRPSRGPFDWGTIVAPLDESAGGTWWAINRRGLFVGLTNRAGATVDRNRRSRGQLVVDAAGCADVDAVETFLRRLDPEDYNGFHLLAADGQRGLIAVDDAAVLHMERIGPGFHVVSERSFGASPVTRDPIVREQLRGTPDIDGMQRILAHHEEDHFQSLCVHLPGIDYGTRSSSVIALGGEAPVLRFAPGPPCVTRWEDLSGLLGSGRSNGSQR